MLIRFDALFMKGWAQQNDRGDSDGLRAKPVVQCCTSVSLLFGLANWSSERTRGARLSSRDPTNGRIAASCALFPVRAVATARQSSTLPPFVSNAIRPTGGSRFMRPHRILRLSPTARQHSPLPPFDRYRQKLASSTFKKSKSSIPHTCCGFPAALARSRPLQLGFSHFL